MTLHDRHMKKSISGAVHSLVNLGTTFLVCDHLSLPRAIRVVHPCPHVQWWNGFLVQSQLVVQQWPHGDCDGLWAAHFSISIAAKTIHILTLCLLLGLCHPVRKSWPK